MRLVRSLLGLVLLAAGVPLMITAGVGWQLARHDEDSGVFSAELSPVHSDGYAIVFPDVAAAVHRHGVARLLDLGDLRVSATGSAPLVLALAPADEVRQYLEGVSRTVVTGVGYATGAQPVAVTPVAGAAVPGPLPNLASWTYGTGRLTGSALGSTPVALVVVRADGRPGLTVALTAAMPPPGWAFPAAGLAMVVGLLLAIASVALVRPARVSARHAQHAQHAPRTGYQPYLEPYREPYPDLAPTDDGWTVGAYHAVPTDEHATYQPWRDEEHPVRYPTTESPYVHTAT